MAAKSKPPVESNMTDIVVRLRATAFDKDNFPRMKQERWLPIELALEAANKIEHLRSVLKSTQFGFNHVRCPVCAGWNMSSQGETDNIHTPDCPVALALKE